jgi:hypothetical protein
MKVCQECSHAKFGSHDDSPGHWICGKELRPAIYNKYTSEISQRRKVGNLSMNAEGKCPYYEQTSFNFIKEDYPVIIAVSAIALGFLIFLILHI